MKSTKPFLLLLLFAAGVAHAQSKAAPAGQVYRCGNQYVDRPCTEKGGKVVSITSNVVASGPSQQRGNPGARPPSPQCVTLQPQADAMESQGKGQSSNQGLADMRARIESSGC